ncbi:MAG: hypothetical protein ACI85Q_001229 [Salibacteraceae bacterium]|jgi:hypothetical protein
MDNKKPGNKTFENTFYILKNEAIHERLYVKIRELEFEMPLEREILTYTKKQ